MAVREAISLAEELNINVVNLLHVYDVIHPYPVVYDDFMVAPRSSSVYVPKAEDLLDDSKRQYEKFIRECTVESSSVDVEPSFQKDSVAEKKIAEVAKEGDYDVVIAGSRGHSGTALLLVGSIVENLIWNVNVPLFIVKEKGKNIGLFEAFFG